MTRISIAMAVYNGERFIGEQLESLLQQTRLPDELVIRRRVIGPLRSCANSAAERHFQYGC